jgi:ubiquinone/menaquinone biosynthesis C-methylase UbiE
VGRILKRVGWERTDYDSMSSVYDCGRAMPEEWVGEWRQALSELLDDIEGPVLDVGAGTGIWTSFISDWFGVDVIGLEPSPV